MNRKLSTALALAIAASFSISASAEEIFLFDATPVTGSFSPNDLGNAFIFDSAETTVFCDGPGTAYLRTVGDPDNYLIVDNYVTLNDADGDNICQGGSDSYLGGTNCFTSGSSSPTGGAIQDTFSSIATAPVPLVDGENDLTIKLWDWGAAYGNTALELALPENCSSQPIPTYFSMCAAQFDDIGEVGVSNDSENLYVSFEILEPYLDWYIEETHVAVVSDPGEFPTAGKNKNPVPGQFAYECDELGELAQYCVATIPLDGLSGPIYVAAHAAVFKLAGDGCGSETQYASEVIEVNQGVRYDGDPIEQARSDPSAVFSPGGQFFSLGLIDLDSPGGGDLTVGFGYPVFNGPGNDVCVQEVTNGRPGYPVELAEIYGDMTLLDTVSNKANGTGLACVDIPETLPMVDDVTLYDVTNPLLFTTRPDADGYDVDWIGACYLYLGDETAWGAACPDDVGIRFTERGNWGTYFEYTIE